MLQCHFSVTADDDSLSRKHIVIIIREIEKNMLIPDNDYDGFVSDFISDKNLAIKIKQNILFVENNLYKVDSLFEEETEKRIMYRELGSVAFSCLEALLKSILVEINIRCKRKCGSKACRYRRYNNLLKIEHERNVKILSFLIKTTLFYFPPNEVDEIEKLSELRNYIHISKNIRKKIDDKIFDLTFVEKILRYYYQLTDQFDLNGYYFGESESCLLVADGDNMRFEIDPATQTYYFLSIVPVLHKVYLNESLNDDENKLLKKMGYHAEFNFEEISNYAVDIAKRYGRRFLNQEAYESANKSFFERLSKYLSKAQKEELLNKYANIEITSETEKTKIMKFLRCKVCGKIVALVNDCSSCPTKCCGEPMEEIPVNTQDGAHEKHLPVYEVVDNIVKVKVGSVEHPMLEAHYIQWIALETNKGNQRKVLKPGQAPEAEFALLPGEQVIAVYEYCNLHGLYKA